MENRDKSKPFFMMCHFKAPHRPWTPSERFKDLLKDVTIPEPENLLDTYEGKGEYAELLRMSMEHLRQTDVKTDIPTDMSVMSCAIGLINCILKIIYLFFCDNITYFIQKRNDCSFF